MDALSGGTEASSSGAQADGEIAWPAFAVCSPLTTGLLGTAPTPSTTTSVRGTMNLRWDQFKCCRLRQGMALHGCCCSVPASRKAGDSQRQLVHGVVPTEQQRHGLRTRSRREGKKEEDGIRGGAAAALSRHACSAVAQHENPPTHRGLHQLPVCIPHMTQHQQVLPVGVKAQAERVLDQALRCELADQRRGLIVQPCGLVGWWRRQACRHWWDAHTRGVAGQA